MRRRGLSLLEIQLSLLILLLVTLYLMALIASGQKHGRRSMDYSRASALAQMRLEQARKMDPAETVVGTRQEGAPWEGFRSTLSAEDYQSGLSRLTCNVTAPSGARAQLDCLVPRRSAQAGVVSDAFTHWIAWNDRGQLRSWNDLTNTAALWGGPGDGRNSGHLAGSPGQNLLWMGGWQHGPAAFQESLPAPATWRPPLSLPWTTPDPRLATSRTTGLVTDLAGSQVLLADASNRCLWLWDGANWQRRAASNPALGQPTALAADPALSLVWVADGDFQCLRKWVSSQGAAAYAPADLESTPTGAWLRQRFRPPARIGLGTPLGLAMDPHGNRVYLHDRGRLLVFTESLNRWEVLGVLPGRLIDQGPSGLACDRFGEHLFVATHQGALWKVPARPGLTNGEFQQLWP